MLTISFTRKKEKGRRGQPGGGGLKMLKPPLSQVKVEKKDKKF